MSPQSLSKMCDTLEMGEYAVRWMELQRYNVPRKVCVSSVYGFSVQASVVSRAESSCNNFAVECCYFSPDLIANTTSELIFASLRATARALALHSTY